MADTEGDRLVGTVVNGRCPVVSRIDEGGMAEIGEALRAVDAAPGGGGG